MAFPFVSGMRAIEFGRAGDYQEHDEPLEHVGERLAMLDSDGIHIATLLVTKAELVRFADVTVEFAIAEGEGDFTGDEFRAGYLPGWREMGYEVNDDTIVTNVYFDLIEDLRPLP